MTRTNGAWGLALTASLVALTFTAPLAGAAPAAPADHWLGWLGCWELTASRTDDQQTDADGSRRVCVEREADGIVALTTTVDGQPLLVRRLLADGTPQAVDEGGCAGFETARWSADGNRLLVESKLQCEGGHSLVTSGVSLLSGSERWIDIQVASVEGQREVLVRRYARSRSGEPVDLSLAASTARTAAGGPLDLDDVIEAAGAIDTAAVETMLLEGSLGFTVDSAVLMRLAGSEIDPHLIDLMVALSYPDYFAVGADGQEQVADASTGPLVVAYPAYRYGYWSYGFAPFGWGYWSYPSYPYYPGHGGPGGGVWGGRVVNGKGYTRVQPRQDAPGPSGSWLSNLGRSIGGGGKGGSASGGSVSGQGARSGSSSSGTRKAKPRGGSH